MALALPFTTALAAAFADPVRDSQAVFRALMNALARPGSRQPVNGLAEAPAPLTGELAAIALALCDYETPVWLDAALSASPAVAPYLRFHAGAPLVEEPSRATFALVSDPAACPDFASFALGSDEYPDRSTTLVVAVSGLAGGKRLRLEGPGIAGAAELAPPGLPPLWLDWLKANRSWFPRGVDLVLAGPGEVAALPRTTRVAEA